jgi:hypothetical protein
VPARKAGYASANLAGASMESEPAGRRASVLTSARLAAWDSSSPLSAFFLADEARFLAAAAVALEGQAE